MSGPLRVIVELAPGTVTYKRDPISFDLTACFRAAFWTAAGAVMGGGFGLGVILAVGRIVGFIGKAL